jgi:hypothetical protein
MPIAFNLEDLRKEHNCSVYFETGLWDPRTEVSSRAALNAGFKKVFCVEIREDWVALGLQEFKEHVDTGKFNLILDDSANIKNHLVGDIFQEKTMFFLDAHVDNQFIHNYKYKCPLFDELEAIGSLERKDNVILVDDLRIIKNSFPWDERSYGDIDFLQKIKDKILSINTDYKFTTLDGHVKDDVLCAYV